MREVRHYFDLHKQNVHLLMRDNHTIAVYDIAKWDSDMQEHFSICFPSVRISLEMNTHSLSGFIIVMELYESTFSQLFHYTLYFLCIVWVVFLCQKLFLVLV